MKLTDQRVRIAARDVEAVVTWLFWANSEDFNCAFGSDVSAHLYAEWTSHFNATKFVNRLDRKNLRSMVRCALEKAKEDTNAGK